jgi:hypothetical protein
MRYGAVSPELREIRQRYKAERSQRARYKPPSLTHDLLIEAGENLVFLAFTSVVVGLMLLMMLVFWPITFLLALEPGPPNTFERRRNDWLWGGGSGCTADGSGQGSG